MATPSNELGLRRQIGIALRLVPVGALALLWIIFFWWWLAPIGVCIAVALLVLQPLAYPLLYVFSYLGLAFVNSNSRVLPGYWDGYPEKYSSLEPASVSSSASQP